MYGNGACAYQQTNIMTAEPKKLVLMCYEGAISSLRRAKEKYEAQEYEAKARAVQKFQDIVNELLCALNFEQGGEIATNLQSIYDYAIRRVLQADIAKETKGFDEVIGMLEELKEAWEEISYGKQQDSAKTEDTESWNRPAEPEKASTGTYGPYARV